MFESFYIREATRSLHQSAPFAVEREQYMAHCLRSGSLVVSVRRIGGTLLWFAVRMDASDRNSVDLARLTQILASREPRISEHATLELLCVARQWLRYLGWWQSPQVEIPFREQLDRYVVWMRDERGFSASTVHQWERRTAMFLRWCGETQRQLALLAPSDIDEYFVTVGAQRWSRVSASHMACSLRVFLRYAATLGACDRRLAQTIRGPRVYEQESLPWAPSWPDVQRLIASTTTDTPRDIRDRAILMLLAIYGLRSGEVAALRLDGIDWSKRVLHVFRLKRRQPQVYPLLPSVAQALARYIDIERPKVAHPEVFIRLKAPLTPLGSSALYWVVSNRLKALGVEVKHTGPHALRHACAGRLLAEGLNLKEIGDHLGHRSTSATRTYAKVDLAALREVGDFDLGGLQ